ncbi:MAG: HemK/PrmC family methyltransferase, partial [bacterium]
DYISKNFKQEIDILDIGVGSGAISICLAKNLDKAKITGVDFSEQALEVAEKNIKENKLEFKIKLVESNIFPKEKQKFDVIISNPPYIPSFEMDDLPKEVKYEPEMALKGGSSGIFFYNQILKREKDFLKKEGMVIFEIHENDGKVLKNKAEKYGFKVIDLIKDYAGKDRYLLLSV